MLLAPIWCVCLFHGLAAGQTLSDVVALAAFAPPALVELLQVTQILLGWVLLLALSQG